MNKELLVLGLGNTLQTDEGIGVHVIHPQVSQQVLGLAGSCQL